MSSLLESPRRPGLLRAVASRISLLVLTVVLAGPLASVLVRLSPGFGMDERQLDLRLAPESIAALQAERATPGMLTGFVAYWQGWWRGDWGSSIPLNRPMRELAAERAGLTLRSLAAGLALAWSLSLFVCLLLERVHWRPLETVATVMAGGLICLPSAVVVLLLLHFEAGPALTLAVILCPRVFRYVRNTLAASARSSHVLAATARGVTPSGLVLRHVCLPTAPELVTLAGVSIGMAIGAIIPVEALCDSPGLGQLVWLSAMARDLPALVHLTVLVALAVCGANLASDACRALVSREAG